MRIGITGGNGFLGQAVIEKLVNKNIEYTLLDRKKHNLFKPKTLKSFVDGKDVIVHLAAINRGDNLDLFKTNVIGTQSLLEAISLFNPTAKIIFSSTFQVYLRNNLYGLSKKTAEELIIQYSKKSGLSGFIFRISNIYGPGGKPFYNSVIATFAHLIKTGEDLKINGDGTSKRDFIYVGDAAEAIVKACLYKFPQKKVEIIDICSGKETGLKQVVETIKKVSRKKFAVMYNEDVKEKPWPTSGKNNQKALHLLGWKPSTTLTAGLRKVMHE